MGAMRYKPSDKVRIKNLDWYNENKNKIGFICFDYTNFIPEMSQYCGEILTINQVVEEYEHYRVSECAFSWTDEMIEGLVEEETLIERVDDNGFPFNEWLSHKGAFYIPDGYELKDENGNVINATKIVLEKKKKSAIREEQIDNAAQEYIDSDNAVLTYSDGFCEQTDHPFVRAAFKAGAEWADNDVTQDDCSKAPKLTSEDYSNGRFGYRLPAGFKAKLTERELILTPEKPEYPKNLLDCENVLNGVRNDRKKLLHKFNELLICRDAYWKIAGEEMGLGKPWEPNDADYITGRYCIFVHQGNIICSTPAEDCPFTFPTEEMRDAFYEYFKELIESVKELL